MSQDQLLYVLDGGATRRSGDLTLRTFRRSRAADGDWETPVPRNVPLQQVEQLPDDADRSAWKILAPVIALASTHSWSANRELSESDNKAVLSLELVEPLLPALAATERLFVVDSSLSDEWRELQVDTSDEPWVLHFHLEADDEDWELSGEFRRGGDALALDAPSLLVPGGWIVHDDTIARLEDHGASEWIAALRTRGPLRLDAGNLETFLTKIWELERFPPVDWPDDLRVDEIEAEPEPRVWIEKCPDDPRKRPKLRVRAGFIYGDVSIAAHHDSQWVLDRERRVRMRRDHEREIAALATLESHGLEKPPARLVESGVYRNGDFQLATGKLTAVVARLLESGWFVEADGTLYRRCKRIDIAVSSGVDWFDVTIDAQFGDVSAPLPALLQATRKGRKWVTLGDGSVGVLPDHWLDSQGLLMATGEIEEDVLRFQDNQALLLDVLLWETENLHVDTKFKKARENLASFERIDRSKAGPRFVGSLRPYQEEALGWFEFLESFGFGGCLADDMGLGKTVQVLAHLDRLPPDSRPSLVVVPRSLVFNWISEAERFTPELRVLDFTGTKRARKRAFLDDCDLVITTYGTLVREADFLAAIPFRYAVLDEAQMIKNPGTTFAKAARLLHAEHRLALSGTPIENRLRELWSIFEFLNPGMLGSAAAFRRFIDEKKELDEDDYERLSRILRPFILRRTKEQVATELPERTEQTLRCELEPKERELYEEIRDHYRYEILASADPRSPGGSKLKALEGLLRLRQASCHPGLIDDQRRSESSAKVELLLERLVEVIDEGHKALVFSQFTSFLAIVRERLDAAGIRYTYLDGKTRKRDEIVERFQEDPGCRIFLISLKAGGLGLNLTAAEYVFLLDPWWNPASENQAIDRAHRIGQTKNVVAYRLIAKDTVEDKVLQLQKKKRAIAASILEGGNGSLQDLEREDLELLLG